MGCSAPQGKRTGGSLPPGGISPHVDIDFRRKTKCLCLRATSLPVASAIWYASWSASYCCTQRMKIGLLPWEKKWTPEGSAAPKCSLLWATLSSKACAVKEDLPTLCLFPFPLHRCPDPWKVSLPFCGFKAAFSVDTRHLGSHSLQQLQQMLPLRPSVKCNWATQFFRSTVVIIHTFPCLNARNNLISLVRMPIKGQKNWNQHPVA